MELEKRKDLARKILIDLQEICRNYNIWIDIDRIGSEPKNADKPDFRFTDVYLTRNYGSLFVASTDKEWDDEGLIYPDDFEVEI